MNETLLSVEGLRTRLDSPHGPTHCIDGVDLALRKGECLALVGESGCGKTTAGKALLQLIPPTGGSVAARGVELTRLSRAELRAYRARMQIIFQDPYASLDPRMRVVDAIAEGMRSLEVGQDDAERERRVDELLAQVGLPARARERYPHEFSGGQRQRIAIARALAVHPRLIVCDEPTSALDVSVQAQILNLLGSLQDRLGLAYLFITHNLAVVEYLAHEVAVMYLGRIVERGTVEEVLGDGRYEGRSAHQAPDVDGTTTLLADGSVLVVGGTGNPTPGVERYYPGSNTWATTGTINPGIGHSATLLPSGTMDPALTNNGIVSMGAGTVIVWPPCVRSPVHQLYQSVPEGR